MKRDDNASPLLRALGLRELIQGARPIGLPDPAERRRLRLSAAFTQEETALAVGVSLRSVAAWEAGENEPRRAAARRYGAALAVFVALSNQT